LLEDTSLRLLLRTYPESKGYGYGLWIQYPRYARHVPKVAQRFGRIWGVNTLISHFLDEGITVIVLSNTDRVPVASFQDVVAEGFFGVDPE
jgi:CubicO group peptidase (beta-lactamase class C family)